MRMAKLTIKELEALTNVDAGKTLYEDGGIRGEVRSNQSGITVAFSYRYRFNSKTKEVRLGVWPHMSLPEIRAGRKATRIVIDSGKNPSLEKQLDKERNRQAQLDEQAKLDANENRITINTLFNRWERLDLFNHKDKGISVRRSFEKDVLPAIGNMAVEDVKKSHVTAIVDTLLERGVNRTAKLTLTLVRQMFRFAQDRDIVETDPTATIRKAKIGKPDVERDRVLSENEIRELFKKLPTARVAITSEAAIWIALATGCRIGELLRRKWKDVNLENRLWAITSEISKNGEPLTVHLSDFAIKHFKILQSINHQTPFCYANRTGKNHVCTKTITKQIGDRQLDSERAPMSGRSKQKYALKLSGGKWTPHDLRRTAGTLMTALGVLPDVADKCLNHKEQNRIRRTYLRHSYENEKREAWRLLGERLQLLTNEQASNVITLSNKAA